MFMFANPKAEAATSYNFSNFPNFYSLYSQRYYQVQQPKINPAPVSKPSTTPIYTPAPVSKPSTTPVSTPAPVYSSGLTVEEQQLVYLINQERTKANVQTLTVDNKLVNIARMKSQDMIDNNYFSHQSPTYGSPFDMMKAQGVSYRYAGENIAGNQSVQSAHTALMNSSGHRANILNPNYKYVGVGVVDGGPYGVMVTEEFTG